MLRVSRPAIALRYAHRPIAYNARISRYSSASSAPPKKDEKTNEPVVEIPIPPAPPRKTSWLTQKVEEDERFRYWFLKVFSVLGYGSPKQVAGRRSLALYQHVCAGSPDTDRAFWQDECHLPPTFQSWFTITNLHVWMLTVRLRALPLPHGKYHTQFLLDHFFIDIEDKIRAVLQPPRRGPPREPYTFISPFYVNPNVPATTPDGKRIDRGSAPERMVTREMKILREQWMGMTQSFDLAMVKGDQELAATIWRNILGARGARGIAYPNSQNPPPKFRRSVNLVGSEIEKLEKVNLEEEESRDDGSGVHDYAPEEADKYVKYPELMHDTVNYIRRELVRLQNLSDEEIMMDGGTVDRIVFPKVRDPEEETRYTSKKKK